MPVAITSTQTPPTPAAAPTPTAIRLWVPSWSLALQLLRDGRVVAEGASTDQLAAGYKAAVEREPER